MISQLNARLISSRVHTTAPSISTSGYESSESDRSSSSYRSSGININNVHQHDMPGLMESSSTGSSNGYAADISAQPTLPDLMKRSNDVAPLSFQPALKRIRTHYNTAELNYLASKAKEVIEQAGLVYPKLLTNTSRMFPPKSGVNMSGVTHKFSSQCESPFLVETKKEVNHNNYMACPYEMTSLLQSTSSFYNLVTDNKPLPASFSKVVQMIERSNVENTCMNNNFETETFSDSESSTSSVTVSDLGDTHRRRTSNINHFDGNDFNQQRSSSSISESDTGSTTKNLSVTTSAIIPIGVALEISRRPRILTSAQAPYNVVQVNAAFLRLTQSKSTDDFLGKPLEELLLMQQISHGGDKINSTVTSLTAGLKASYTKMQMISVPGYPNLIRNNVRKTTSKTVTDIYHISIVPVGVPPSTSSAVDGKITHFAIKFSINNKAAPDRSHPSSSTTSFQLSNTTRSTNHHRRTTSNDNKNCAIHVMG